MIILPLYDAAQDRTKVRVVDEYVYPLLAVLKQKNIPSIMLTSRRPNLAAITKRQLATLSLFVFQIKWGLEQTYEFPETNTNACYTDGILFAAGSNKGTLLKCFFERLEKTPAHIFFIDDSLKNVRDVEQFAQAQGIAFDVFHFTRVADELSKTV